jgi:hypothetical protein
MNPSDQEPRRSTPNGLDKSAQEPGGVAYPWTAENFPLDEEYARQIEEERQEQEEREQEEIRIDQERIARQLERERKEEEFLASLPPLLTEQPREELEAKEQEALAELPPLITEQPVEELVFPPWTELQPDTVEQRVWEEGENNFVEKFIALQGLTETPNLYFRFVAISIISAVLQNKVWLELYPGSPLYPNLYTFLIGKSGIGKGQSIGAGMKMLSDSGLADEAGAFTGSFTAAALIDFLASKAGKGRADTSRAFIVSPEFASSIKWGDQSDAIIKTLTDLFTADLTNYTDMTRGKGIVKIGKPCVSWLAASTREWLVSNLKPDAIRGGFMARCLFVEATRKTPGVSLPEKPPDYELRFGELQLQLISQISQLRGEFVLSAEAQSYLRDWYTSRVAPISPAAQASWNRHRELALKVALSLCAGDPQTVGIIEFDHLNEAISLIEMVKENESNLWSFVGSRGKTQDIDYVARRIRTAGTIYHTVLLNACASARGILGKKLHELILTLEQSGKIRRGREEKTTSGRTSAKTYYEWIAPPRPTIKATEAKDDYE